jgi:thioredoxin-like negative regulator of GroEL
VTALAFLGVIGYFLKIGLGVTGSALGPEAKAVVPVTDSLPSTAPGEVTVPQSGGGNADGGPNGVGGGTPAQVAGAGPPAPVQRLLLDLRQRIAKNPSDLAALVNLANLYFDAAKYPQAIDYYKRALALDPANPDTRTDYATALHGKGDDLQAIHELEAVLRKRPDFPEALFNEGVVANAIGRRSEAVDAFKRFLKVKPGDSRAGDARQALANLGA